MFVFFFAATGAVFVLFVCLPLFNFDFDFFLSLSVLSFFSFSNPFEAVSPGVMESPSWMIVSCSKPLSSSSISNNVLMSS